MYAVAAGLIWLAFRRARDLPFTLAAPYEAPVRRPLLTLAIMFTAFALVGALVRGLGGWFGLALLALGTVTFLVWFVRIVVGLLSGRGAPAPARQGAASPPR
jgi:hypothetical protein